MQSTVSSLDEQDAILSDDIESRLSNYLSKPDSNMSLIGEILSQSYHGTPDVITTLLEWTSVFTDKPMLLLRQSTEMAVRDLEQSFIPQINDALHRSNFSLPEVSAMCASTKWKDFFSEMGERHPDSVLTNAMQRENLLATAAVSKSSLEGPISFCKAFSDLLESSVGSKATVDHTANSNDFFKRVSVLCAYDESATKTALYLLARLSREADTILLRHFYRRLAQHIRKEAVNAIIDIRRLSSKGLSHPIRRLTRQDATKHIAKLMLMAECTAIDVGIRQTLIDSILTVILNTKDVGDHRTAESMEDEVNMVTHIFALLIGPLQAGNIPIGNKEFVPQDIRLNPLIFNEKAMLIRFLCHEEVLEGLFNAAFSTSRRPSPGENMNAAKKRCLCILLAFAGTFIEIEERVLGDKLRDPIECRKLVETTGMLFGKIEIVVSTCENLKPGSPRFLLNEALEVIVTASRDLFVSRGVLIWAKECLHGGPNLRDLRVTAPAHLAILSMIADKHIALRTDVVSAIGEAMVRDYPGLVNTEVADLQSKYMTCLLGFIRFGMGHLIADAFVSYMADNTSVDLSHLRRFVFETLRSVKPPFSKSFAGCMQSLIAHPRLKSAVKEANMAKAIANFRSGIDHDIIL